MSSTLGMKIIRQTRSGKFEELCNLDYFNKIKSIVDYMDEFTVSYPDQLKKFMQDKEASYEVFNINSFRQFVNLANNKIEGYLFKNKKEYINKISELIKDNKKRFNMGNQGRINAETYSSKYFAERVLDVYKLALKGRPLKRDRSFIARFKNTIKS